MHHANATREQDRANKSSERGSFLFKKPNSEALQDQREHLICRLVIVVVLDPISIIDGNQLMDSPKAHLSGGKQAFHCMYNKVKSKKYFLLVPSQPYGVCGSGHTAIMDYIYIYNHDSKEKKEKHN